MCSQRITHCTNGTNIPKTGTLQARPPQPWTYLWSNRCSPATPSHACGRLLSAPFTEGTTFKFPDFLVVPSSPHQHPSTQLQKSDPIITLLNFWICSSGAPPETLWRTPLRIRPHQHHLPTAIRGKGRFLPTGSTWFNVVPWLFHGTPKRMVVARKLVVQMRKTSEKKNLPSGNLT